MKMTSLKFITWHSKLLIVRRLTGFDLRQVSKRITTRTSVRPTTQTLSFPLLQPCLDKLDFLPLYMANGVWRHANVQIRLVFEERVFVPVMNGIWYQQERLRGRRFSLGKTNSMGSRCAPRISFSINDGNTGVREFEFAVFVDRFDVWE